MLVSVIIPVYNRAGTIESAVDSVLSQTYRPLEIIVVDDGSTDGTVDVLARYGEKIRLIRQDNQGPSGARNTGIKAATGEIISFLDSDDSWLPKKTERQVKLLQRASSFGVGCCVCNAQMIHSDGRSVSSFAMADLKPARAEGIWSNPAEMLLTRFLFFNQVVAVRREMLERAGLFRQDLRIMEDYDLALRLSLSGPWAFINDPLVRWNGGANNSLSRNISELDTCLRAYDILLNLSRSSRWGRLMPRALLRRRLRFLSRYIWAKRLLARPGRAFGLFGRGVNRFLRGYKAVYYHNPFSPRMMTREM